MMDGEALHWIVDDQGENPGETQNGAVTPYDRSIAIDDEGRVVRINDASLQAAVWTRGFVHIEKPNAISAIVTLAPDLVGEKTLAFAFERLLALNPARVVLFTEPSHMGCWLFEELTLEENVRRALQTIACLVGRAQAGARDGQLTIHGPQRSAAAA